MTERGTRRFGGAQLQLRRCDSFIFFITSGLQPAKDLLFELFPAETSIQTKRPEHYAPAASIHDSRSTTYFVIFSPIDFAWVNSNK